MVYPVKATIILYLFIHSVIVSIRPNT